MSLGLGMGGGGGWTIGRAWGIVRVVAANIPGDQNHRPLMKSVLIRILFSFLVCCVSMNCLAAPAEESGELRAEAAQWRQEKRLIDMHVHVNSTEVHLARAVRILDNV